MSWPLSGLNSAVLFGQSGFAIVAAAATAGLPMESASNAGTLNEKCRERNFMAILSSTRPQSPSQARARCKIMTHVSPMKGMTQHADEEWKSNGGPRARCTQKPIWSMLALLAASAARSLRDGQPESPVISSALVQQDCLHHRGAARHRACPHCRRQLRVQNCNPVLACTQARPSGDRCVAWGKHAVCGRHSPSRGRDNADDEPEVIVISRQARHLLRMPHHSVSPR